MQRIDDNEDILEEMLFRLLRQRLKGNIELSNKICRQARRRMKNLLKEHPTARLHLLLADTYINRKYRKVCYHEALRLEYDNPEALYGLAYLYYWERNDVTKALTFLEKIKKPSYGLEYDTYELKVDIYETLGNKKKMAEAKRRVNYWRSRFLECSIRELDPGWDKPDILEIKKKKKR